MQVDRCLITSLYGGALPPSRAVHHGSPSGPREPESKLCPLSEWMEAYSRKGTSWLPLLETRARHVGGLEDPSPACAQGGLHSWRLVHLLAHQKCGSFKQKNFISFNDLSKIPEVRFQLLNIRNKLVDYAGPRLPKGKHRRQLNSCPILRPTQSEEGSKTLLWAVSKWRKPPFRRKGLASGQNSPIFISATHSPEGFEKLLMRQEHCLLLTN